MKNMLVGFVLGLMVSGSVWAGAGQLLPSGTPGSRPDQQWEHDRGAAVREYQQQQQLRRQAGQEQKLHELQQDVETMRQRPC